MALGKRRQKQTSFWVETSQLQARGRRPFYSRLNELLGRAEFDAYAERICRKYYATTMGRPSIAPGVYFRCFLVGYFEGIDSERGIASREGGPPATPRSLCGAGGPHKGPRGSIQTPASIGSGAIHAPMRSVEPGSPLSKKPN